MEQDFYKQRLIDKYGIDVVIPDSGQREDVHNIIFSELCLGQIKEDSRNRYLEIIENLQTHGAEAVILGCTEIAMLVQQSHTSIPLYDTTEIHALKTVEQALKTEQR